MDFADLPAAWPDPAKRLTTDAIAGGRIGAVRSALAAVEALTPELRGRSFKLAILRTFTLEAQVDCISLALCAIPCRPSIVLGDLENVEQVLLDPSSQIMAANPDALLLLWRLEELAPEIVFAPHNLNIEERLRLIEAVVERVATLCDSYRRQDSAPLFVSTLPIPPARAGDTSDLHQQFGWREALLQINQTIFAKAAQPGNVYAFDFAAWSAAFGAAAFDRKMDLFARQPVAGPALPSLAGAIASAMRPLLIPASKVLAVDLDNVLWGGVVGEDGIAGLKIGRDYPGNVYLRIQQVLLNLKSRGILLALLSKNNGQDVVDAFATLADMPLRLSDFAAMRINWRPKHENLREIAVELNLGLDSFVFVDDQTFEREQMMYYLPEVKVLGASEDPLQTLTALTQCRYFDVLRVSTEDRARAEDYAAQTGRQALASASSSPQQFLESLQLRAVVAHVNSATLPRAAQMLAKTNQFNATARRYGEAELGRMARDPANLALTLSLSDRFSDQGIVGLAIGLAGERTDTMRVDVFLLSCRALGRGAEQVLWASLVTKAAALGYRMLQAEYLPTAKNGQVADLFDRLGMERVGGDENGRSAYQMSLEERVQSPAWVSVTTT